MRTFKLLSLALLIFALAQAPSRAVAQPLPGPADAGRVRPEEKLPPADHAGEGQKMNAAPAMPDIAAPQGAETIHLVLKDLKIEGATVFTQEDLSRLYTAYIGQDITLDVVYKIANDITQRYRDAGYFLSLAFVPDQKASDGVMTIRVVEGYIGQVDAPAGFLSHRVVRSHIENLTHKKPVRIDEVESFLLRLNDLHGYTVTGTLSTLEGVADGGVRLTLQTGGEKGEGQLIFDNYGSRFLGPHELSLFYAQSLLPLHKTSFSALTSVPFDELNYVSFGHAAAIARDVVAEATVGITRSEPGYNLKPFDVESDSSRLGLSLSYQWIRQRQKNVSFKLGLDAHNTSTDFAGTPFTRDRIRALRATATCDLTDQWRGFNLVNLTLSRGLDALGASDEGTLGLSRAQARPDFTKAEISLTRLQSFGPKWSLLASAAGQHSSAPLFSAEEFGYGGQAFGRAYDSSEITGDDGLAAALELRYDGWYAFEPVGVQPYAFYDIGRVWNRDTAQVARESASSAGLGFRAETKTGLKSNLTLAWPLTRDIDTPIYGNNSANPRLLLQISKSF